MRRRAFFLLNRCITAIVFFCLLVSGCGGLRQTATQPAPISLTVLFFNDLHGHLMPFEIKTPEGGTQEVGGIARMATLIQEIRQENNRKNIQTVVLVAGDILQGTPMSTVFEGEPDIKCLNAMGVNALTVGNHEFDFGLDNFLKIRKEAAFPFLSANIIEKEGERELLQGSKTPSIINLAPEIKIFFKNGSSLVSKDICCNAYAA
jgi:2',3'-cyclic-nucleotide 2'-phosphodiesterase (5'-nucleotidase family)